MVWRETEIRMEEICGRRERLHGDCRCKSRGGRSGGRRKEQLKREEGDTLVDGSYLSTAGWFRGLLSWGDR